ncbi:hypothetical protein AVEN_271117-1 [Araneus ventricosus]|uniref:Uncharacterized protein n=1 Tax=Araneus ventricosus TaxID=182803 RepID=A0A4Y2E3K1_ARAVE|nr:hypothetical protein AVEN_271117-1 [Araneus ventricosus]
MLSILNLRDKSCTDAQLHLKMATVHEECTLEGKRSVVSFLWAKGLPAKDSRKEMLSVYSENRLLCQAVYCNIYRNFGMQFERKRSDLLTAGILFQHNNPRLHTARLLELKALRDRCRR